ncbi:MAG: anti-sigma factor antagonist [Terriglobales bacterium]
MPLSLNTRGVGRVTVVRCSGRIIAGDETESLRVHVTAMMRDRKDFVLHLGDVAFIDSSGLGTMVRLLTRARQSRGDLKLCNVPQTIEKLLCMTNLNQLFEAHESEESAISAFYRRSAAPEATAATGPVVVCVDQNTDVLAYLRELLRHGGYDVHTSTSLSDTLVLIRVTRPALLLVGPDLMASPATQREFNAARAQLPVMELGKEFSTLDASEAASRLLDTINTQLAPKADPNPAS